MAKRTRTGARKEPSQERAKEMVNVILTAAGQVFSEQGFEGATTNRIAKQAGISVGSLYQYFSNKDALIAALVEQRTEKIAIAFKDVFGQVFKLSLREGIQEAVRVLMVVYFEQPKLQRVLVEQMARVNGLATFQDVEAQIGVYVRAWLEACKHEIRQGDLEEMANVLTAAVAAITHVTVLFNPERVGPAFAAELVELISRYLKP